MKKVLIIASLLTSYLINAQDIGGDYYVAVFGDDTNPGTYEAPWATWQKAFRTARPGDTVYIRGGVYYSNAPNEINPEAYGGPIGSSGTRENPICFFGYPGEWPILDCIHHCENAEGYPYGNFYNAAISLQYVEYIHFKDFEVRNVFQCDAVVAGAINSTFSANLTFEHLIVHDVGQRGFYIMGGVWNEWDGPDPNAIQSPGPFGYDHPDTTRWINCDVYNLFDSLSYEPGNAADAWKTVHYYGNYVSWEGCRAWNYGDDGFDPTGKGAIRVFKDCWAMASNKYTNPAGQWETERNGFKIPGPSLEWCYDQYVPTLIMTNCLTVFCQYGFYELDGLYRNNGIFYNNTAYKNMIGFAGTDAASDYPRTSVYKNNIAYGSTGVNFIGEPYELLLNGTSYEESHNVWDYRTEYPYYEMTDTVRITDADFLSVDSLTIVSLFTAPRQPDGSLPEIKPLMLAQNSDLIDAGVDVGLSYNGEAPDIGAFEHGGNQGNNNLYPYVVITSPADGSRFYEPNNDITIIANAIDPDGSISKVEFFEGSTKLGEKTSSPWSYRWNNVSVGSHTIWARATDNQGATAKSSNITITVERQATNSPPSVVITSPTNGSTFYEPYNDITIWADANDPDGSVRRVEFYDGSIKLGEKTSSPWSYTWNNAPVGNHSIWVRATDNQNATARSSNISVTVEPETENVPPNVSITSPTNGSTFYEPDNDITIRVNANDPDGTIKTVKFFDGSTTIGVRTSPPWTYNWHNVPVGSHTLWAQAVDNEDATASSSNVSINVEPESDDDVGDATTNIGSLYPNPNNGSFTFILGAPFEEESEISIVSLLGKQVYSGTLLPLETTKHFDLSFIKPGLYILLLSSKEILVSRRFIKF